MAVFGPKQRFVETGFSPAEVSAVTSWFRLAHANTTISGSGYNRIEDVLNPSSPATQTTDALRPPNATSGNGLPIVTVASSVLSIPVIAARDGTTAFGFWGWFRRTGGSAGSTRAAGRALSGASADKFQSQSFPNLVDLQFDSLPGVDSIATVAGASVVNTWQFETYEFNGGGATDADRLVITKDGVVQTVVFTGSAFPATLPSITGTLTWLAQQLSGSNPFVGSGGPNFGYFGSVMSGVTSGLLTPAARTALMNFEAPT